MTAPRLVVERATEASRQRYLALVTSVFAGVEPARLRAATERFTDATRLFAMAAGERYLSVLFVTPVTIGGHAFGGIGGVCTASEHRGCGYGIELLERAVADTAEAHPIHLLWTRIPGYFSRMGFTDMAAAFVADPAGSTPMMRFAAAAAAPRFAEPLPRVYF